ncbi:MAG: hypothetical protein Q8M56_09965 [Desulfobacterales bacterium]|nr:hypothetical protein [Desulfobacterales bacterium]
MTQAQFKQLQAIEKAVDKEWDNLSNWEQKFIEDILERFKLYGQQTLISPKQGDHVERIWEKIV